MFCSSMDFGGGLAINWNIEIDIDDYIKMGKMSIIQRFSNIYL